MKNHRSAKLGSSAVEVMEMWLESVRLRESICRRQACYVEKLELLAPLGRPLAVSGLQPAGVGGIDVCTPDRFLMSPIRFSCLGINTLSNFFRSKFSSRLSFSFGLSRDDAILLGAEDGVLDGCGLGERQVRSAILSRPRCMHAPAYSCSSVRFVRRGLSCFLSRILCTIFDDCRAAGIFGGASQAALDKTIMAGAGNRETNRR